MLPCLGPAAAKPQINKHVTNTSCHDDTYIDKKSLLDYRYFAILTISLKTDFHNEAH